MIARVIAWRVAATARGLICLALLVVVYSPSILAAPVAAAAPPTNLGTVVVFGHLDAKHPIHRTLCIFDPVGANGLITQAFDDYRIWARSRGIAFKLVSYTDESVVVGDFKARHCDAMIVTGIRARHFVPFAGSLDMVGGLQTYAEEHTAITVMASAKAAPYMQANGYAVAGVIPGGKVFLLSRRKAFLDSLDAAAGKKVAVIDFDPQARVVAEAAGAAPVPATLASFGPLFNNHSVDMAYAPALAFQAFELYKGLGRDGGVADYPLGMLSLQMVIHANRFPADFALRSRKWILRYAWPRMLPLIHRAEASIPAHYWVHIDAARRQKYSAELRKIRERLWKKNVYSHRMQRLLKKIRCAAHPSRAECGLGSEGGAVDY